MTNKKGGRRGRVKNDKSGSSPSKGASGKKRSGEKPPGSRGPAKRRGKTLRTVSSGSGPRSGGGSRAGGGGRGRRRSEGGRKLSGVLEGHARGFGFVRVDEPGMEDVFIPPAYLGGALHGDRVEILFHEQGRDGRTWGEVVKIIERRADPVIGYWNGLAVIPRDPRFLAWIKVHHTDSGGASPGDMVVVELTKTDEDGVHGRVIEVLGAADAPGIESRIVLRGHGFNEEFTPDAEQEAKNAPAEVSPSEAAGRRDLRPLFTITIDPAGARDFDDAISIERTGSGFRLWVSIADVSHYVRSGSAIDDEAYERATSVYFPDRAVHMLPEELSAGVCSLKPGVDRLAMTAEMDFDGQGKRRSARFYCSVIRSDHRLTYEQVEEMEHEPEVRAAFPGAWPAIEIMRELAGLRTRRRKGRGSIDLDVPEPVVIFGADGEVADIARSEQTWSHRLIEEFMLIANETVASFMEDNEQPMIYRVHEPPAPVSVVVLADLLAPLGFQLLGKGTEPENIKPRDFQRVIGKALGTPYEMMVKVLCLRTMMQARYNVGLLGHFGLAADRYCHFTSPIRRYPDLVVHRLLKQAIGEAPGLRIDPEGRGAAPEPLPAAALHCSERERAAMEAEREMTDLYRVLWMARHLGEDFEGTVSGVTPYGLFVELEPAFVEGLVPAATIDEDLEFHEGEMVIRGKTTGLEFRIGDRVRVRAVAADLDRRKITFRLLEKL